MARASENSLGISSVSCGFGGYFLKVIRDDLRGDEELSGVAAFSGGPSPHEDCLAEVVFVDDVRGGVLETERVKHARQEEVQ